MDLCDAGSVQEALRPQVDAVVHLAALASGREARRDPTRAWVVNAAGTATLAEGLAEQREKYGHEPKLLLVSSLEVYGDHGPVRVTEQDECRPQSPYAGSKLAAEIAGLECWRRTGLQVVIARPTGHGGAGQSTEYVLAAIADRIVRAKRAGAGSILVGNLNPVRDFLHVGDVVEAYIALLEKGEGGSVYNICSGVGISLAAVVEQLVQLGGGGIVPEPDPSLMRAADLPYLVGDAHRLSNAVGWAPRIPFADLLGEALEAAARAQAEG